MILIFIIIILAAIFSVGVMKKSKQGIDENDQDI
jgi:hypothetical protein